LFVFAGAWIRVRVWEIPALIQIVLQQ